MVDVLVGGKRREEVLEAELQRLARIHEEPGVEQVSSGTFPFDPSKAYTLVEWEPDAHKDTNQVLPHWTWNERLPAVITRGYERYPTCAEMMSLIMDYHERFNHPEHLKAFEPYSNIAFTMLQQKAGIWSNQAIQRVKDMILIYENPQGIQWNEREKVYTPIGTSITFGNQVQFQYPMNPDRPFSADVKDLPESMTMYLFGRSFEHFPETLKHFRLTIPKEGRPPQPFGLSNDKTTFEWNGLHHGIYGVPWGVRKRKDLNELVK